MAEKILIRPDKAIAANPKAFEPKLEGDFVTIIGGVRKCTRCAGATCALEGSDWVVRSNSDKKVLQILTERSPLNCGLANDHEAHTDELNTQTRTFGRYKPDVQLAF